MIPKNTPRWFGWLWLTLFTVGPLLLDAYLFSGVGRQLAALRYPTVPGVVTHSQVESRMDDDGFSYTPDLRYEYTVQGARHTGHAYRYFLISSDDSTARHIVDAHPVGKQVTVHYNPADPSDAVLQAGLSGSDLFLALFLLPFNVVMVGAWSLIGIVWWRSRQPGPFAGFKVSRRGSQLRLHLDEGRLMFAGVTVFASSIVVALGVGFCAGTNPPLWVMIAAWAVVGVAAVVVYFVNGPAGAGLRLLVLDAGDGTLKLYRRSLRAPDAEVFDWSVKDVIVEPVEQTNKDGTVRKSYLALLIFRDADGLERQEVLADETSQDPAEALAAGVREWLADRGCLRLSAL